MPLSLLKKTGTKGAAAPDLAWHPDFRIGDQLPDTKTVRTQFFINILAIGVAATLALYVGWREWGVASLNSELAGLEQQILQITPASDAAAKIYKSFQAEEKKFKEAYQLVATKFDLPIFMLRLGELMPPGLRINRVEFRGEASGVFVSASMVGADIAANDRVSSFERKLQQDTVWKGLFASITLTNLSRNVGEGISSFELNFTFSAAAKPQGGNK